MRPLLDSPLTEQVHALRTGLASAEGLWLDTHQRIDRLDPVLAAYIELAHEPEWHMIRSHLPLAGVPVAVKANIAIEGLSHSAGVRALAGRRASVDATVVQRLRDAGAVVIGTTNMPEDAVGSVSNNPWYGSVRNPRKISLTAGGSSGGSAAAVAAGMASCSLGTDTMGSVRIPAAFCGLVGLKPSAGVVPTEGLVPLSDGLDTIGPIGRTVADVALLFSVIAGRSLQADTQPPNLRVALLDLPVEYDLGIGSAFWSAVSRMQSAVEETFERFELGLDLRKVRLAGLLDVEAGALEYLEEAMAEDSDGFSDSFRSFVSFARRKSAVDLVRAQRVLRSAREAIDRCFERYDLLVCPTVARPPQLLEAGEDPMTGDLTAFANAAGIPALSLPAAGPQSLPIGVQLLARRGADSDLLAAASMFEQKLGWDPVVHLDVMLGADDT